MGEVISIMFSLNMFAPWTDDFAFTHSNNIYEKDTLIIHNPPEAICFSPVLMHSRKTLTEHIDFIAEAHIKKAIVVAEDISFLRECPDLEDLRIVPPLSVTEYDYSPVYDMPNLRRLSVEKPEEAKGSVALDVGRINGLRCLSFNYWHSDLNLACAQSLKTLYLDIDHRRETDLGFLSRHCPLENLSIGSSHIVSLLGIENAPCLKRLNLYYNRRLESIENLRSVKNSLIWLEIDSCNAIRDYSVLAELENLEYLSLKGSKSLPSLDFIGKLEKLKCLIIKINVLDGDLSGCLHIPYVSVQNKRHYSHNDSDFSKERSFSISMCDYEI